MMRWSMLLLAIGCEGGAARTQPPPAREPVAVPSTPPIDPILEDTTVVANAVAPDDLSRQHSAPLGPNGQGEVTATQDDSRPHHAIPPGRIWATSVRGVSSEYSATAWSASRTLGPPQVFPHHLDSPEAWASKEADRAEWIELGFVATRVSTVEIYETFNPGAVERVALIAGGKQVAVLTPPAATGKSESRRLEIPAACTDAVTAVRIELASHRVAGWNELDAVGLVPCN